VNNVNEMVEEFEVGKKTNFDTLNTSIFIEIYKEKLEKMMQDREGLGLEEIDVKRLQEVMFMVEKIGMFDIKEPKLLKQIIEMN